jgi:hypothetical protein
MDQRGFAILPDTISRWDDDPMNRINDEEKRRITNNVKRALESQGETVELL